VKIIELKAENVKRLKAVEITPDAHLQIVGGRNAQGKSSVLDAIFLALGGGAASKNTPRPIRDGEDSASVRLDLGDMIVTRTWSGDKTVLKVESKDGAKYSSPQAVLDSLVGRLSFDPLEFTRLSAKEQVAALLDLVQIDLVQLESDRKRTYEARTEAGRNVSALEGQVAGLGGFEDAPDTEVSASDLITRIREAEAASRKYGSWVDARKFAELKVSDLKTQLADAENLLSELGVEWDEVVENIEPLEEQLAAVEGTNAAIRRNKKRTETLDRLETLKQTVKAMTSAIESIDAEKADSLSKAKFPVPGLGFNDEGVTFEGIPFAQVSSAEQIRVSLGMAMSLNPKLRVIRILDGSLLDAENLALIEWMCRDQDYQLWLEKVGDSEGIGVVIEDGSVISVDGKPVG
jgi:DNA repair exonuclease SbcCD ATPase subunit